MSDLTQQHSTIKKLIKDRSPFDKKETSRILDKYFGSIPADVKILVRNHQFDRKKILDIGCSYGQSLLYWGKKSEGIEIQGQEIKFLKSLNRIVHGLNVEDGFLGLKKNNYDAIYSNNLIEHLVAPHLFLVRLHSLLKSGGVLAICHPVVPPFPFRNLWKLLGYHGWTAVEHINFFTPQTIKLTLERAGFKIKNQYSPGINRIRPALSKICAPLGNRLLSVCQAVDKFKYNPKRLAEFDPSWGGDLKYFR